MYYVKNGYLNVVSIYSHLFQIIKSGNYTNKTFKVKKND